MKKIRATVVVEMPYEHELLCYIDKLNSKILEVLQDGKFSCTVQAGDNLPNSGAPINEKRV